MLGQWLAAATVSGRTDTYTPPLSGPDERVVSLAGNWAVQVDAENAGLDQQWFRHSLPDRIQLPGMLDERGKGSLNEKRETGKLSRVRTHTGPAWFQREIEIPAGWASLRVIFSIERSKATQVWLDDRFIGSADSLSVEQCFDLGTHLAPGPHKLTVRADNAHRPPVGDPHQLAQISHSLAWFSTRYTCFTSGSWFTASTSSLVTRLRSKPSIVGTLQDSRSGWVRMHQRLTCTYFSAGVRI